jgi:hypothetical protein
MASLAERVAATKLPLGVTRKAATDWSVLIEREVSSTGEPVLVVLREHHNSLDEKIGVVAGLAGFLGAAVALFVPTLSLENSHPVLLTAFGLLVGATAYSAFYALSALSTAAGGDQKSEDLEVARTIRLARRAVNHAMALNLAKAGALLLAVFLGMNIGVNLKV